MVGRRNAGIGRNISVPTNIAQRRVCRNRHDRCRSGVGAAALGQVNVKHVVIRDSSGISGYGVTTHRHRQAAEIIVQGKVGRDLDLIDLTIGVTVNGFISGNDRRRRRIVDRQSGCDRTFATLVGYRLSSGIWASEHKPVVGAASGIPSLNECRDVPCMLPQGTSIGRRDYCWVNGTPGIRPANARLAIIPGHVIRIRIAGPFTP